MNRILFNVIVANIDLINKIARFEWKVLVEALNLITKLQVYSWTSLCRSGRDPEKYFDIGMVRRNQMGIMGSQHLGQSISLKKNAYLQAYPFNYH